MATPKTISAIKRYRTAKLAKLLTKSYYLHRRGRTDEMYQMVCLEFISLGGVYVKFLQGVLLRSEMMRRWGNPERLKIFENLDCEPINVVAILQHELTKEKLKEITSIQPEPFAAGSFGQVYYGQHESGKPIIIKVLRPMVRELLKHDLRLLGIFSKQFFARNYKNMDVSLNDAVKDFIKATRKETDYIAEARFADEMYQYYKNHSKFVVPQTFTALCTPNIIVQEYVDGISAAHLVKLLDQGVDPKVYIQEQIGSDLDDQLETLGFESIIGVFNLEHIQGDPHPGNVRFMSNDRVGLIDFGISAPTPTNKAAFFGLIDEWNQMYKDGQNISRLFEQFMRFFVSDLYRALKKLSTMARDPNTEANFTKDVGNVAQQSFSNSLGGRDIGPMLHDGRILVIINQMINKNNRFGLVMKLEASEMLRAAQTYITLVESLGRRSTVLPKVFQRVVTQVEIDSPDIRHKADDSMSIHDALTTVSNWLERVAERDPVLFKQLMTRIKLNNKPIEVKEVTTDA